jgi:uncharacterized protein (UPF0548 family)
VQPLFDVFHPSRPTAEYLKQVHQAESEKSVTYSEVGRSLGELPSGYHHLNVRRTVGTGDALMQLGRAAINTWSAQAALKLDLYPVVPEFVEGTVLVFALPMRPSPFWATGACRIIRIVDEPNRYGFVYGTLPHHPESGEEAFLVSQDAAGEVSFSITAFSRARTLPMRVSGPIGRVIQRKAAEVYLDGYERFVADSTRSR